MLIVSSILPTEYPNHLYIFMLQKSSQYKNCQPSLVILKKKLWLIKNWIKGTRDNVKQNIKLSNKTGECGGLKLGILWALINFRQKLNWMLSMRDIQQNCSYYEAIMCIMFCYCVLCQSELRKRNAIRNKSTKIGMGM